MYPKPAIGSWHTPCTHRMRRLGSNFPAPKQGFSDKKSEDLLFMAIVEDYHRRSSVKMNDVQQACWLMRKVIKLIHMGIALPCRPALDAGIHS
ncbi:predicted protein [Sclerotinia sclerotiorum 1980 UF-70]|uniref:Uncharacterized protein n=1 Tax=Sclerotinia sclerotiorum (strain ATCC 18683 / 1980 / Ss-1) TaxID=665079 RepID=A7ER81_SCLS1|nr:predicted protein [Sclerotinia sclerotiorum 1980 UF-70]EDN91973.1 predicted protein [Sclerotinia sclerotiorum 1980 UF-70]